MPADVEVSGEPPDASLRRTKCQLLMGILRLPNAARCKPAGLSFGFEDWTAAYR